MDKQLRRGVHCSKREIEELIARYAESTNAHAKPLVWTNTAGSIQTSQGCSVMRTSNSESRILVNGLA